MKTSIKLPIPSYHSNTLGLELHLETEAPVETAVSANYSSDFSFDSLETRTNGHIDEATLNAEKNRRFSLERVSSQNSDGVFNPKESPDHQHLVTFGTESEVEYCADETPKLISKTTRNPKDFDGNRSGRPSAKD